MSGDGRSSYLKIKKNGMMQKEDIKTILLAKTRELMDRYDHLSFKYAYSPDHRVYLVSYMIDETIADDDVLWDDLFDMKQSLKDQFGDNAPLFSLGDRTFRLPANAKSVRSESSSMVRKSRLPRISHSNHSLRP